MRHRKLKQKLSGTSSHRKAMLQNLSVSLMEHGCIKTTVPKAKALRVFIEPLITRAKEDSVANRRLIVARLRNKAILNRLFVDLGPLYADRPGGYVRILKCGFRQGDAAPMAFVEFVDAQSVYHAEDKAQTDT